MYSLLYYIDKKHPGVRGGFIHVPFIPEQVVTKRNMPSMDLTRIVKALEAGIKAVGENLNDKKISGGKEF